MRTSPVHVSHKRGHGRLISAENTSWAALQMPNAFDLSDGKGSLSMRQHSNPCRTHSIAIDNPTGPAPMINTSVSLTVQNRHKKRSNQDSWSSYLCELAGATEIAPRSAGRGLNGCTPDGELRSRLGRRAFSGDRAPRSERNSDNDAATSRVVRIVSNVSPERVPSKRFPAAKRAVTPVAK